MSQRHCKHFIVLSHLSRVCLTAVTTHKTATSTYIKYTNNYYYDDVCNMFLKLLYFDDWNRNEEKKTYFLQSARTLYKGLFTRYETLKFDFSHPLSPCNATVTH